MRFLINIIGLIYYYINLRKYDFRNRQLNDIDLFKKKIRKLYFEYFKHNQYSNKLFSQINFNINDTTVENFKKISILKKRDLKKNIKEFYYDGYNRFSIEFKTSGSTGEPITSYTNYKH